MQNCNTLEELISNFKNILLSEKHLPLDVIQEKLLSHVSVLDAKGIVNVDNDNSDTYFLNVELTNGTRGIILLTVVQPKVLINVVDLLKEV